MLALSVRNSVSTAETSERSENRRSPNLALLCVILAFFINILLRGRRLLALSLRLHNCFLLTLFLFTLFLFTLFLLTLFFVILLCRSFSLLL
jgi:hypothetical protein